MAEAAFAGSGYGPNVAPGSVTYYGNFGNSAGAALGAHTTEAQVELVHRGPDATLKNLRVVVTTNARASNSSVTTRKNNADTSQVATITASTTGTYTDLTNTVSVTAGDKIAYKLVIGSTTGNFAAPSITVNYENSSSSANFWSAVGSQSTTNGVATRYWNVAGSLGTATATEAAAQMISPAGGTLSNLRAYVTAARATNTTLKTRVNGADGAQSVTMTASTTGAFEDTTNTDTIVAGDLFCAATVTGSGTDTLTLSNVSVLFTTTTSGVSPLGAGATSTTLTSGVTRYYTPVGHLQALATESQTQQIAPFAGTASRLSATVTANASTTTSTMVLRKNGADTAVTFTIAGGATGSFVDTTNTVSVSAGDLLSIQGSGSDGTVTFRSMSLRYAEVAGPISGSAAITEADDTVSSAGTVALKGSLTATEASDTVSSAGALAIKAALAATEDGDTVSATGGVVIKADAAITEEGDTLSSFAGAVIYADFAVTEADDTLSADSVLLSPIAAVLDVEEADDTLSAVSSSLFWQPVTSTSESWTQVSR